MKFKKKLIALITVCALCLTSTASVFAADANNNVADIVQNVIDENHLDASAVQLQEHEYQDVWNSYFSQHHGITELNSILDKDGFVESAEQNNVAVEITDNGNGSLKYYYYYKFYENAAGEKVVAMFIHSPNTKDFYGVYAEKIDTNNIGSEYYSLVEGEMPEATTYSVIGFLCGLSGTVACGAFSAMIFAFVPASIAVGMTCGAAFDWVCSR